MPRRSRELTGGAIVELAVRAPESTALHRCERHRRLVASALARPKVVTALLPSDLRRALDGPPAARAAAERPIAVVSDPRG